MQRSNPRPTRSRNMLLLSGVDLQQLPPYGWCATCGAEVYTQDAELCTRCMEAAEPSEEVEYE